MLINREDRIFEIESRAGAAELLPHFRGLWKVSSWLALHALDLPALFGVVLLPGAQSVRRHIAQFAAERSLSFFLIRTDKEEETGQYPRGGYLVRVEDVERESALLLSRGRVVILLEPKSPFSDLYSLNCLLWPPDPLVIEVVGPGFDASDLKRGDISPHERWRIAPTGEALEVGLCDSQSYRTSWERRWRKVRLMLAQELGESDVSSERAREILEERRETLLLETCEAYSPIPRKLVMRVAETAGQLGRRLEDIGLPGEPFAVSMSYFERAGEAIYWDIVWPHLKYEGVKT